MVLPKKKATKRDLLHQSLGAGLPAASDNTQSLEGHHGARYIRHDVRWFEVAVSSVFNQLGNLGKFVRSISGLRPGKSAVTLACCLLIHINPNSTRRWTNVCVSLPVAPKISSRKNTSVKDDLHTGINFQEPTFGSFDYPLITHISGKVLPSFCSCIGISDSLALSMVVIW